MITGKLLVANRGEIAIRICRAAAEAGLARRAAHEAPRVRTVERLARARQEDLAHPVRRVERSPSSRQPTLERVPCAVAQRHHARLAPLARQHEDAERRLDRVRREPDRLADARADDRFNRNASVHAMKLRSVIAAPIPSPEGAVGALYLDNRLLRDRFGEVELDLLRAFRFDDKHMFPPYDEIMARPVREVMATDVTTVTPRTPLTRVLETLVRTRNKSLPVVDDGAVVGVIAREDVLQALRRAVAGERPTSPI